MTSEFKNDLDLKRFLGAIFKTERTQIIVLLAISVAIHIFFYLHYGVRNLIDSAGYLEGADFIVRNGTIQDIHHFFYIVPIALIAFFNKFLFSRCLAFLAFQSLLSLLATVALYKAADNIYNSKSAAFLTGIIFILWLDNRHWDVAIMTESLMSTFICFLIYSLSLFKSKSILLVIILILLLLFTRPTAFVPITAAIIYLVTLGWNTKSLTSNTKKIIVILIPLSVVIITYLMFLHWDFTEQYVRGNIVTYMNSTQGKAYYSEYLHLQPKDLTLSSDDSHPMLKIIAFVWYNPFFFFKMAVLKLFFLLFYVRPYYSTIHNVFTFSWMIFIYLTAWFGLRSLKNKPFRNFAIVSIVFNCLLIAISSVDWDNRFYIPMEAGIVILAGGGLDVLLRKVFLGKRLLNINE